jgi:mono/diheme cytochrome c family protein
VNGFRIVLIVLGFTAVVANSESLIQRAPETAAAKRNPFQGDGKAERAGAKLYARECASCHGRTREGKSKAPPLTVGQVHEVPSGALFWVLTHGSLGRGMPSFAHLPEARRWQIVAFLQGESK